MDIRMHLLRHAHASWLLEGGADLMDVKERLVHASILTTERYLHTVGDSGAAALAALEKVRASGHPDAAILERLYSPEMVREEELASISTTVLFEFLSTFQAELNRRLVANETKAGVA